MTRENELMLAMLGIKTREECINYIQNDKTQMANIKNSVRKVLIEELVLRLVTRSNGTSFEKEKEYFETKVANGVDKVLECMVSSIFEKESA